MGSQTREEKAVKTFAEVDWHKYCEVWEYDETARERNYFVMGDDIRKGDWYFSDGYLTLCDHRREG